MAGMDLEQSLILQELLNSGKLTREDIAASENIMRKSQVNKVHPYAISQRKDGRFITKVKVGSTKKQFTGVTEYDLYRKLYDFYFSQKKAPTLKEAYEKWMVYRKDYTAVKPKTLQEGTYTWKKFFADTTLADTNLTDIKAVTVSRFFRSVTKDRAFTQKRINEAKSLLTGIMQFAIEEEWIEHNPVPEINFRQFTYKPVENPSSNVFSVEEAIKLLSYLENITTEPYALAIRLDFNLMIRIGELKALKWEDVDFDKHTVYIHEQCLIEREMNDDLTFKPRKTVVSNQLKGYSTSGYRVQPLTPEAEKILAQAKKINPTGEYIFMPDHRFMTTDSFNRRLKSYCNKAGIPYYSSHKIRFFAASCAFSGENLTTVSKLMGHTNVQTTMHYLRDIVRGNDDIETFRRLGLDNQLAAQKTASMTGENASQTA